MTDSLVAAIAAAGAFRQAAEHAFATETIGAFLRRQAAETPGARALDVFDRGERLTYSELLGQARATAYALSALGIGKGDRVGLMMQNRADYPVTWLGLALLGAVHVPINLRYTADEAAFVLSDSGAAAFVHDDEVGDVARGAVVRCPDLSAERVLTAGDRLAALRRQARPVALPSVAPGDLANIQYTSGTTGRPKGCMLTHDYWMRLSHAAHVLAGPGVSRFLTAQPFFYMDPQWQLLMAMRARGTLLVAPRLSSTNYVRWLREQRAEWCQFPVLMARRLAPEDAAGLSLKSVFTFGWDGATSRKLRDMFGVVPHEGFGMTEIGLGTWMAPPLDRWFDEASVGIDAPFRETTIRDGEGRPVEPGGEGELWVRGPGLFQGYWNRPEATAEVTVDCSHGGRKWFRTGDLFRADAHGRLWIVGRLKDMVRRSGENIACREVEEVIKLLPWVEDAAILPIPDPDRGEEVGAVVILRPDAPEDGALSAIRSHAANHLASFKTPRYLGQTDAFPRMASNKTDKRQLIGRLADGAIELIDFRSR